MLGQNSEKFRVHEALFKGEASIPFATTVVAGDTVFIAVEWHGPFATCEEAIKYLADSDFNEGLYLSTRFPAISRWIPRRLKLFFLPSFLHYVGMSTNMQSRFGQHLKSGRFGRSFEIASLWIGRLNSVRICISDNGKMMTDRQLAEHLLIYSLEPSANKNGKQYPPRYRCTLVSNWRFVRKDDEAIARDPKMVPDLLDRSSLLQSIHYWLRKERKGLRVSVGRR